MARALSLAGYAGNASNMVGGSGGLLLLCMVVVSLSIISTVMFACGDNGSSSPSKPKQGGGCGTGCGAGCGGC
uniref:Uncharacterized protein n=1 Tax=Rhizophora mucronata TaxID=61149 RepID=A0A2P2NJL8_RHIMU